MTILEHAAVNRCATQNQVRAGVESECKIRFKSKVKGVGQSLP